MSWELKREPDPDCYNAEKQAKALRAAARILLKHANDAVKRGSYWSGATHISVDDAGVASIHAGPELFESVSEGLEVATVRGRRQVVVNGVVVFS